MTDTLNQAATVAALRRLLRPVAQLALARGLPYPVLDDALRSALVDEARRLYDRGTPRGLPSRISAATGLTRRETVRLLAADAPQAATTPPARSLASEVFARWLADPSCASDGRPRVLPRTGDAPSFDALARSVTRDVHPRTLLGELCRLGLARWDEDTDTVALVRAAFVPQGDFDHHVGLLGENVGDHLQGAVENVLGQGSEHFEQAIFADELSPASVQALRPVLTAQWAALFQALVPDLERRIAEDRAHHRPQTERVRIGLYSYTTTMAAADDATSSPAASSRTPDAPGSHLGDAPSAGRR